MPEEIIKEKTMYRRSLDNIEIRVQKRDDKDVLIFPVSSETPVERWYGMEILSHQKGAIRMDRAKMGAMPLLFNHNIDHPIGMVDTMYLENGRAMVEARLFSTDRAKEVEAMIAGGLRNVSVSYRKWVIEENKKGGTYIATDWEPYEVSVVSVPADFSVGIGRGVDEYEVRMVRASLQPADAAKEERMTQDEETKAAEAARVKDEADAARVAEAKIRNMNAVEMETGRKKAITQLCHMNKLDDKFRDMWIGQGLSLEEVADELLKVMEERSKSNPQPASKIGLTGQETSKFSLRRAILACKDNDWRNAPFELECSRAVATKLNVLQEPTKFFIPFEVLQGDAVNREKRDATAAGSGGYLVATNNVGFIEILRNRSVAFRMGVRRLSGLSGNVTIPKQTVAATAYWLANEGTGITEGNQTFVQIALTPKTVGAYTEVSRQLLLQSDPSAEAIVSNDLAAQVALAADLAVLNGGGTEQPTGIIQTGGIGSVSGTNLAYAGILEFQTDVAAANVIPQAGGYVTTPAVAGLLSARARFANTDTPLWSGNLWDATMAGFPAMSSMQMPTADMLFGDWSEVVVGEWGVLEVEVNPYANFAAGIIGVRAIYSMDVAVRRAAAFSLATSIT